MRSTSSKLSIFKPQVRKLALILLVTRGVLPTVADEVSSTGLPPSLPALTFGPAKVNVRDCGATADGKTNDTAAINRAIENCAAAGGGEVIFPAGTYAAASIHLRSNIHFVLDANATITGAPIGYDPPEPNPFDKYQDFGHSHFHNALIWGERIDNFAVTGGQLNGGALIQNDPNGRNIGDKVISIVSGRNLIFENIIHQSGAHFVYLLNDCENVTLAKVEIRQSRDGVNLVNCRNVRVHGCRFTGCGDDAIAIKTDYALGRKIESSNVYVWDCYFETAANALQIGAETIGDFHNLNFWKIDIGRAWKAGIGITCSGGAVIEGVSYRDIAMRDVACPILLRVTDGMHTVTPNKSPGAIRDVTVANVRATACKPDRDGQMRASFVAGRADSPIENVTLQDVQIDCADERDVFAKPAEDAELETNRALTRLPATALYVRHAKKVRLENVRVSARTSEALPAISVFDIAGLQLNRVEITGKRSARLRAEKIKNFSVRDSQSVRSRQDETLDLPVDE